MASSAPQAPERQRAAGYIPTSRSASKSSATCPSTAPSPAIKSASSRISSPGAAFAIIAVEDLIADRMGQYASGTARDMLAQAQLLLSLHPDADMDYLDRRIRHETAGDFGANDVLVE